MRESAPLLSTAPVSPTRRTGGVEGLVPAALELVGLTKRFGHQVAVDHINLVVPSGSFFGVVGPNGAGKTTALAMATGLQRPDRGTARIFGVDVWSDGPHAKALIGILPDDLGMPERLAGIEVLTYLGLLRGLPENVVRNRALELLDVLELPSGRDKLVIDYSTGMRKKIGLAVALLHAPRLLVLDEPFEAVDPVSAMAIRTILQRFVDGGGSVVISSHVMTLIEQLCDRVAVIHQGRIMADGTLAEVQSGNTLEAAFVRLVGATRTNAGSLTWLQK